MRSNLAQDAIQARRIGAVARINVEFRRIEKPQTLEDINCLHRPAHAGPDDVANAELQDVLGFPFAFREPFRMSKRLLDAVYPIKLGIAPFAAELTRPALAS